MIKIFLAFLLLLSPCYAAEQIADFSDKSLPVLNEELRTMLKDTDTGTTAGKVLKLDSSAKIPAVDGSQITNVDAADSNLLNGQAASYYTNASNMASGTLAIARGGTGVSLVQRGRASLANGGTVTYPTSFGDTSYTLLITADSGGTGIVWSYYSKTATGFTFYTNGGGSYTVDWLAIDDV